MKSLEAGRRLAKHYVLLERLGDGGHSEVWSAKDESGGRRVALKIMHQGNFSAGEATVVLRHEAQMVRLLDHPGVLRVEEPQRDGLLVFLPMEYAGGGDATRLRGASWQKVLPVVLQVAHVLEHAHSRGVVHRDVKPGNILFDSVGRVRVTDFGTASRTGSTVAMSPGSPFSASPQQLRGEAAITADDVYGLGALVHELLTAHPPYYPDLDVQRVQTESPARPVPVLAAPDTLLDLVQAMLAREPEERPDLAQVMQSLEQELAAGLKLAAAAAPAAAPVRGFRHTLWWIVAAVVAGATLWLLQTRKI
jgi:eukaryotic-like serine/threonine-protein kinase